MGFFERRETRLAGFLGALLFAVWGAVQLFKDAPSPPAIAYFTVAVVFLVIGVVAAVRSKPSE